MFTQLPAPALPDLAQLHAHGFTMCGAVIPSEALAELIGSLSHVGANAGARVKDRVVYAVRDLLRVPAVARLAASPGLRRVSPHEEIDVELGDVVLTGEVCGPELATCDAAAHFLDGLQCFQRMGCRIAETPEVSFRPCHHVQHAGGVVPIAHVAKDGECLAALIKSLGMPAERRVRAREIA